MPHGGKFTIGEVAAVVGVSRRRVDEWVREGILTTQGRAGRWKLIPLEEVELAQRVLKFARRHGFAAQVPRGLFEHMRAQGGD